MQPITTHPILKILCLSSLLLVGGCISSFQVEKVAPNAPAGGIQYSLPIPALQVCPGKDGSLSVEQIYLPDPNNTYAISAKSYLSKFELTVDRENGMLTKLSWNPDSTVVAGAVAEASGALAKARFDAEVAAQKIAATEAKAARDKVLTAKKAVRDAKAALASAKAVLAVMPRDDPSFAKELVQAQAAVAKATAALEAAQLELVVTQQATTSIAGASVGTAAASDPRANDKIDKEFKTVLGCALYIVEDTGDDVALKPVLMEPNTAPPPAQVLQRSFKTSKKIDGAPPKKLEISIEGSETNSSVVRPRDGALFFIITASTAFEIAKNDNKDIYELTFQAPGQVGFNAVPDRPVKFTPNLSQKEIRVDLDKDSKVGDYRLTIEFKVKGETKNVPLDVEFKVEKPS